MNDSEDHDLLIEIRGDIKHVRKDVSMCNERYNQLRKDINHHDRQLNRIKGATAATIVFLTVFGAMLLYLFLK